MHLPAGYHINITNDDISKIFVRSTNSIQIAQPLLVGCFICDLNVV